MAGESMDIIRLEGDGSAVVLRVTGREGRTGPGGAGGLTGEFAIDTPFVRGTLATCLSPADLRDWQEALDTLDAGSDAAWREGRGTPWLYVERDDTGELCHVTLRDPASRTSVTVTVPLADSWFDEAYRRLDLVWDTWPTAEGAAVAGTA